MTTASEYAKVQKNAVLCSLLASETRILILLTLIRRRSLLVQEIAEELDMTHSAISHQLGLLTTARVVVHKKMGRTARYAVATTQSAKILRRILRTLEDK
jgi:DNA-binding transcriptional ArsR family regulator